MAIPYPVHYPTSVPILSCSIFLAAGLSMDICCSRIPNAVTLPAIVFGFVYNAAFNGPVHGLLTAAAGLLLAVALLGVPFAMGRIGGGDVKLLAAVGSFLGPAAVGIIFIFAVLTGACLAGGLMIYTHCRKAARHEPRPMGLPYSIPIALGFGGYLLLMGGNW
jgi:prepilin peptidase CpaA